MPRIQGVDIPNDKPTHISLRYIYGIGPTLALRLCEQARVDPQRRAKELSDEEISRLAVLLDREYTVEGPLRRQDGVLRPNCEPGIASSRPCHVSIISLH